MPPQTRYAKSGEVNIAYQVVGYGPFDLVFVPGFVSHLDLQWAEPRIARFLDKERACPDRRLRPLAAAAVGEW
jgi:hypothetical protein